MTGLTQIQAKTLRFLTTVTAPSLHEICHNFGWASTTSARCVLAALEKKRYIRIVRGRHRGIEVLRPVPDTFGAM